MVKISAVIITLNEEKNIERCIHSLQRVADEIVVVDSFSTDHTQEICNELGVRFIQHKFEGYRDQKNYAASQTSFDHILSLDADEALSVQLQQSILDVKLHWSHDAYKFNRLNYFCGKWIRHTAWYPDAKIRLYNRTKGEWSGGNIHETIKMSDGSKGFHLKGDLLHWTYTSYEQLVALMNKYSTMSANEYYNSGKKVNFIKIVLSPTWRFIHSYIIRRGFLDGYAGYFVSVSIAKLNQLKYVKLQHLYKSKRSGFTSKNSVLASSGIRVGIDAKRAFYNKSGLGNYSRNLIKLLVQNTEKINVYNLFTPKIKNRIPFNIETSANINVISPKRLLHRTFPSLWRSKGIVKDIKESFTQIYHGLSHELPFGIEKTSVKSVVTIHDLIFLRFPIFFNPIDAFIYKRKVKYACDVADKIVAISNQTKADILEFLDVNPEKIEVIHQGCNEIFHRKATAMEFARIKEQYSLPDEYLLYVGTIEERKNLLLLLKAMQQHGIATPLVAIGRKTEYFRKVIEPFVNRHGMSHVIFPNYVTNDDLPAIYQNAKCFIYPSLYEGFGIPILEALTSGTPVITSKGGCFQEAGGEGALYIDSANSDELARAIKSVLSNSELRQNLVNKGLAYASMFTSEVIASKYFALYQNLLK